MFIQITCGTCRRSFVLDHSVPEKPICCPQCGKAVPKDMKAIIDLCLNPKNGRDTEDAAREPFEVLVRLAS